MPHKKPWILLALLLVAVLLGWQFGNRLWTPPVTARILFLGDEGLHNPSERFAQLRPVLRKRGIELVYTNQLDDLRGEVLDRFDGLMVYANHDEIGENQERALLRFVEEGGALIAVHSASFCFRNSPAYVQLVGAQFKSHGEGRFHTQIVDPTHPSMQGVEEFETWDETYVHHLGNSDRHVLMVRQEGDHQEPWTWTLRHGRGRVFYTAYGHDHRTWSEPGFHRLIEGGIRWAIGAIDAERAPDHPPLEYAEAVVPLYRADRPWRPIEPLRQMQLPLEAEDSMTFLELPPGFQVNLFASDPDIVKPVALAWDERGRLWIAETVDYPNHLQPEGKGSDRIKICEDTTGDGRADTFTVFAEGLSIPTSLVFYNGGIIVAQPPHMLFLRDTTGDGRADERRILFTGWETWDTHAGPSNLRWGFDNWIWGTVGYSGFKGTVGGQEHEFRQGIFRFRPDGTALEFLGSTSNNTWGLGFSEEGFVFASTANNQHSVYLAIPNRYYEGLYGWSPGVLPGIANHWRIHPTREFIRQVDWHGGFTAAAGHALYTARSFPRPWWNRVAFVAEPTGSLLHSCVLQPQGSHFISHDARNLLVSQDEWTAPIFAEVGPDGAVWVIDWYNFIIQHNPTPHGFETGPGNAYVTPLRDKERGRIYRVSHPEGRPSPTLDLSVADTRTLVESLRHENLFWRLTAQRLLVENQKTDALPLLLELLRRALTDELGLNPGALHSLWTLHGLGLLDGSQPDALSAAREALGHESEAVRRTALMVLPNDSVQRDTILRLGLLADESAHVRMAALLALSQAPSSEEAGKAILAVLGQRENLEDQWIPDAATAAAARHNFGFLRALSDGFEAAPSHAPPAQVNLIENSLFLNMFDVAPANWGFLLGQGTAEHGLDTGSQPGARALRIRSSGTAQARWSTTVEIRPYSRYRLSGRLRTVDVEGRGESGALIRAEGLGSEASTTPLRGTTDWTTVETTFSVGNRSRITLSCVLGGEHPARGEVLFEGLELVRLETYHHDRLAELLSRVAAQFAQNDPGPRLVPLLVSLKSVDPQWTRAVLGGLASSWPPGRAPQFDDADRAELSLLMQELPVESRQRLLLLADRWGLRDVFSADVAAITRDLQGRLADASLPALQRGEAARRLLRLEDTAETIGLILRQLSPQTPLDVVENLLRSLAESRADTTGRAVIERWGQLTPAAQAAAATLLLRRSAWTHALLDALERSSIAHRDLNTEQWQWLTHHQDPQVTQRALRLTAAAGRSISPDREAVVFRLMPAAQQPGDVDRGRVVFEENCRRCHAFEGAGGEIGPDLTGVGNRSRPDLLVDILDPNRSVEGNYRLWIVTLQDGQILTGRLDGESQTTVELLESTGERHVIPRPQIAEIRSSPLSIMPDGFEEALTAEDLAGLLEFLSRSRSTQ